jgi:hypothetical protein
MEPRPCAGVSFLPASPPIPVMGCTGAPKLDLNKVRSCKYRDGHAGVGPNFVRGLSKELPNDVRSYASGPPTNTRRARWLRRVRIS